MCPVAIYGQLCSYICHQRIRKVLYGLFLVERVKLQYISQVTYLIRRKLSIIIKPNYISLACKYKLFMAKSPFLFSNSNT